MKEPWIIRVCKKSWTPVILGLVVSFGIVVALPAEAEAAAIGGVGTLLFVWIAIVKGFVK
jgi:hypothetical protein